MLRIRPAPLSVARRLAVLGVAVALAGCAQGSETASDDPGDTPTETSSGETSTGSTGGTSEETPTETEEPDEGFFGSLIRVLFPSSPNLLCTPPVIVAGTDTATFTVERLTLSKICIEGRRFEPAPSLSLTPPGGQQATIPVESGSFVNTDLEDGLTTELGVYTYKLVEPAPTVTATTTTTPTATPTETSPTGTVTQTAIPTPTTSDVAPASRVTTWQVEIVPASQPRVRLDPSVVPGTDLSIQLAGYPASTEVRMAVYRARTPEFQEPNYDLEFELETRTTDAAGEFAGTWTVPADAEAGPYVLWTDPAPEVSACEGAGGCTGFRVE